MIDSEVITAGTEVSFSKPFCAYRSADYAEFNECLEFIISEITRNETLTRRRSDKAQRHLSDAVRSLILDLFVAWKINKRLLTAIPLGNAHYTAKSRYRASDVKWSGFKSAYSLLIQEQYIDEVKKGFYDRLTKRGRNTRIRANERLLTILIERAKLTMSRITLYTDTYETIILRDADKKCVEYDDTDITNKMRIAVSSINRHLQKQLIDIDLSDKDFELLQGRMARDYERGERETSYIDLTQKTLVRIFNNSDWNQGGRFYRGWWQGVPKEYRKFITINGKRTCEVDYSGLHPVLLYAEIGKPLDESEDAYDIGLPISFRPLVKETFNKMINAAGKINPPNDFPEEKIRMNWRQLQATIAEKHAPIKQFFNTGYGLKLQRTDSALAEAVMLRFKAMNYTCLPIHDSFLVHHALVDELKTIMVEEFANQTGHSISVKVIQGHDVELPASSATDPLRAITDWFNPMGENAGYLRRQHDWYSN